MLSCNKSKHLCCILISTNFLSKIRVNAPTSDKNGTSNINIVNGFSNRNVSNQTNSVGNPPRPNIRNSHPQQYHSYQTLHFQQQQLQQPSFQVQAPEMRRIDDNVIRLPRGPDGTAGFMLKR